MASKRTRSNPIKVIDKLDPRVKTKEYRTRTSDYDVERQVAGALTDALQHIGKHGC